MYPLLERHRYTDEEWELASAGLCDWVVATYPSLAWCGEPAAPDSFYRWCTEHDGEARDENPAAYGR